MSKWESTPFETLESAHAIALKLGLNPSTIIDIGQGIRSFQTKVGRQRSIIAQKLEGGPVLEKRLPKGKRSSAPIQDPNAPSFGEEDRLLANHWGNSRHATFDAVRAHYQQLGPSSKHRFTFVGNVLVIEYPSGDVIEYRQPGNAGVQVRHLFSAQGRYLEAYKRPKPTNLKAEFRAGAWEMSHQQTLEEVEEYWRKMYVNFDNVEIVQVTLYRIGQDEYEYAVDANTDEVWCRVLVGDK